MPLRLLFIVETFSFSKDSLYKNKHETYKVIQGLFSIESKFKFTFPSLCFFLYMVMIFIYWMITL